MFYYLSICMAGIIAMLSWAVETPYSAWIKQNIPEWAAIGLISFMLFYGAFALIVLPLRKAPSFMNNTLKNVLLLVFVLIIFVAKDCYAILPDVMKYVFSFTGILLLIGNFCIKKLGKNSSERNI